MNCTEFRDVQDCSRSERHKTTQVIGGAEEVLGVTHRVKATAPMLCQKKNHKKRRRSAGRHKTGRAKGGCRRWTLTAAHHILPLPGRRLRREFVEKSRDGAGGGGKTRTQSAECREEEKDLKGLHLGGDKQTRRQKQPRKSHSASFILMFRWIRSFSNKQSL